MNLALSEAWPAIRRKIEERIEDARDALEANLSDLDTARRRGAISELRSLIDDIESDAPKS